MLRPASASLLLVQPARRRLGTKLLPPLRLFAAPSPPCRDHSGHGQPGFEAFDIPLPLPKRREQRLLSNCSVETIGSTVEPMTRQCSQESTSSSECLTPTVTAGAGRRAPADAAPRRHQAKRRARASGSRPPATVGNSIGPNWKKGKPLGAGSFGTVYKAFDPATSQIFAVKEVAIDSSSAEGVKRRERLGVELSICESLRHPNIVTCLGHVAGDHLMYIYLELVPGGSMAQVLSSFGALGDKILKKATWGMLEGLDYLHTRSPPVVHRDIKGANLLVDTDMSVKLTDFGCSKWCSETKSFTTVGSVPWMAPEVISQAEGHGRKGDIWSFGCTVIEMATAEKPWGNRAFDNIMFAMNHIANTLLTPPLPESASLECKALIRWCTRRSQCERPTTTELRQHSFFVPS